MYDDLYKPELTKIEENYRKKIQSEIISCYNCQPYDEGEPVWIFGNKTEIEDLFYKLNVDDKYWNNIIQHLVCKCGTELDFGSDVGVKNKYEKDLEIFVKKSNQKFVKKINEFRSLLIKTPLLGYQNSFGKAIYKELKNNTFPIISLSSNEFFFRARKVSNHDIIESHQMLNAPTGKSTEGRFNHSGQSHLYLANTEETAIKEVAYNFNNCLVWVQEFEFLNDIDNILDLTFDITNLSLNTNPLLLSLSLSNSLEENENNIDNWRPDYFLTRFIMDCAKSLNYNGIKYNSSRNAYDFNLVLFYPDNFNIQNIGNPKIEILKKIDVDIFDI
ncbi:hypothetical protein J2X97_000422 [Epilithonimonas hungarica]|uniref:RES family NAD+ phosphorylase n=1 Tax=Epilithonimonas hungarica TaxID=454006 RepID=UPI00278B60C7|nr:RES family NAD+ phosphorylase [Epilithonimonas hungarica]MDP9954785.1 hypothetical protein [Epilithonimonas hungarica]